MTDNLKTNVKEYQFSLVRLRPECKIVPTYADFQPLFGPAASSGGIIPAFNDDHCHFTPAFLLPSQKKTQLRGVETEKLQFEHRVRQTISSSDLSKLEEKGPSSNYCQICQEYFKNYDQHLEQRTHIHRSHNNEFNEDIQVLCHLLESSKTLSSAVPKRKFIKKIDREDSVIHAIKSSPKTTVDNFEKRKTGMTGDDTSSYWIAFQNAFKL